MSSKSEFPHASAHSALVDAIVETSHDGFIGMDAQGCITHWNGQAEAIFGWPRKEAIGQTLGDLVVPPDSRAAHRDGMEHYLATGVGKMLNRRITMQAQRRSGELFPVELTVSAYTEGAKTIFFAFLHDAQERQLTEGALFELARTDTLTGLPNRRFLLEKLQDTMHRVQRTKRSMAVMFLDMDHFKNVNDSYGHNIGDQVLIEFGARLKRTIREVDFVARLGGDEFMVIAEEQANEESATNIARKIVGSMIPDFIIGDHRFNITTSIGIALYEGQSLELNELMSQADQAMYQAKQSGRNTFRFFRQSRGASAEESSASMPLSNLISESRAERKNPDFIQESVRAMRKYLGMDIGFVSRFTDDKREFIFVDAQEENPPIKAGDSSSLEDSYCLRVVDGRLPEVIPDAFLNDEALSLTATKLIPVRAHISVPIRLKSGEIYGTYCCFSYSANQSLNDRDRNMMRIIADLVASQIEDESIQQISLM